MIGNLNNKKKKNSINKLKYRTQVITRNIYIYIYIYNIGNWREERMELPYI